MGESRVAAMKFVLTRFQKAGIALGGEMAYNLLLVAWPNDNEIVFSTRYTT